MPRQAGSDAPAHPQGLELNMTERYVRFWVQINRLHGFPIPGISGPAIRVFETCLLIQFVAVSQDHLLPSEVAVVRSNETNATV